MGHAACLSSSANYCAPKGYWQRKAASWMRCFMAVPCQRNSRDQNAQIKQGERPDSQVFETLIDDEDE